MKATFRHRQAVQQLSGDLGIAMDELVSAINVQPMEIGDNKIRSGSLTPEGRLVGNPGDLFMRIDGGVGTVFYIKQTGTNTKTGWTPNGYVAFPLVPVPSSDPTTLDDYREGLWTPTDGSGAALAFAVAVGSYTKIGQRVDFSAQVTYPATASGAAAIIDGLPFTDAITPTACAVGFQTGGVAGLQARVKLSSTQIAFTIEITSAAVTNVQLTGAALVLSGSYRATT